MKKFKKKNFPVDQIRRYLEPGPIVLVSSHYKGENNIMTMGWHMVMEFSPSLVGFYITPANHSFNLIKKSKECVINIPTSALIKTVIDIGNTSGKDIDKFAEFNLTAGPGKVVDAPLIDECYASFECKVVNTTLTKKYCFFILEVVKAHVAPSPKYPTTIHYRGDGKFMISGKTVNYKKFFKKQNL